MSRQNGVELFEFKGGKEVPFKKDPIDEAGFSVRPHQVDSVVVHNVHASPIRVEGREKPLRASYNAVVKTGTTFVVNDRRFVCR